LEGAVFLRREIIKEGKTVNEAIDLACAQLGVTRDTTDFEILELPKKAFLGLKSSMAKVRVVVMEEDEKSTQTPKEEGKRERETKHKLPIEEADLKLVADGLVSYLKGILENFGVTEASFESELTEKIHTMHIKIENNQNLDLFEKNDGELVLALQHMGNVYLNKRYSGAKFPRIVLNLNNCVEKRSKRIEELVRDVAKIVLKTGVSSSLKPMSSYERMLVHTMVATLPGVGSNSIGEGANRRVILFAKD
jgi:spoIIIJ-associated protein